MRTLSKGVVLVLALLLMAGPSFPQSSAESAYRAGDYKSAEAHWAAELSELSAVEGRGALLYNMGNAAFRDGRYLEAVARYTGAIEESPRSEDYWANLELARSRAGLDAADRGDLAATAERLYTMFRLSELELLAYALIGLFAVALFVEALRGGRLPRVVSFVLLFALLSISGLRFLRGEKNLTNRVMVISEGGASLRSEPSPDLPVILQLNPGAVVGRKDSLLGWIQVECKGTSGWLEERLVFPLDRN